MAAPLKFERIAVADETSTSHSELQRTEVPGGWLVRAHHHGVTASLVFVPDAEHEWDVRIIGSS